MGYETKISTKGQVVLPKAVRDRLNWQPGETLEVVEHPGGLTLRAVAVPQTGLTVDEIFEKIRAINPYRGPRVSDEEIDRILFETAVRNDEATNNR